MVGAEAAVREEEEGGSCYGTCEVAVRKMAPEVLRVLEGNEGDRYE